VSYHGHYKLLRFDASVGSPEPMHFALVQCGSPHPRDLPPHTRIIEVPVRRLATANESIYGALADLGAVDVLVGLPNFNGVTVPEVRERIERGGVVEMYGWGHSSIEPALALDPDVYLTFYSAYPEFQMHPTLWRVGVQAMPQADHIEATPLGRAEWIKVLALLLNREARADTVFADIEQKYEALKALVANVEQRKRVISGYASQRDTWDTQGGRNFRTQLIRDAGGYFAMTDDLPTTNGWLMLPFERVYAAAGQAPIWYGGLQGTTGYAQLIDSNPLYVWLRAVRERQVHAFDKGYRGEWSFPSVDQGMTRPHWSLEDAIRVLHPERLPHGEFHFVRTLQ
jgi:iron complex transport system substrate-binding protein